MPAAPALFLLLISRRRSTGDSTPDARGDHGPDCCSGLGDPGGSVASANPLLGIEVDTRCDAAQHQVTIFTSDISSPHSIRLIGQVFVNQAWTDVGSPVDVTIPTGAKSTFATLSIPLGSAAAIACAWCPPTSTTRPGWCPTQLSVPPPHLPPSRPKHPRPPPRRARRQGRRPRPNAEARRQARRPRRARRQARRPRRARRQADGHAGPDARATPRRPRRRGRGPDVSHAGRDARVRRPRRPRRPR